MSPGQDALHLGPATLQPHGEGCWDSCQCIAAELPSSSPALSADPSFNAVPARL